MKLNNIYQGDALEVLKTFPDESVDCVVTSPPYWALRDYGIEGQLGLEPTFEKYIENLLQIFDEIYRVLKKTGTVWVNLGDTYGGSGAGTTKYVDTNKYLENSKQVYILPNGTAKSAKLRKTKYNKSLLMIPERFAISMIDRGWILRNQIIWHKPNAMSQSVKDRFTVDFEKIFFFVKNRKYYFEQQFEPHKTLENRPYGIVRNRIYGYDSKLNKLRGFKTKRNDIGQSPQHHGVNVSYGAKGRNKRTVWRIPTKPFKEAHFAMFPPSLPETCIKAGCPVNGIVLDPFIGAGTTALIALQLGRKFIGIELNPEYIKIAEKRLKEVQLKLNLK